MKRYIFPFCNSIFVQIGKMSPVFGCQIIQILFVFNSYIEVSQLKSCNSIFVKIGKTSQATPLALLLFIFSKLKELTVIAANQCIFLSFEIWKSWQSSQQINGFLLSWKGRFIKTTSLLSLGSPPTPKRISFKVKVKVKIGNMVLYKPKLTVYISFY